MRVCPWYATYEPADALSMQQTMLHGVLDEARVVSLRCVWGWLFFALSTGGSGTHCVAALAWLIAMPDVMRLFPA